LPGHRCQFKELRKKRKSLKSITDKKSGLKWKIGWKRKLRYVGSRDTKKLENTSRSKQLLGLSQ